MTPDLTHHEHLRAKPSASALGFVLFFYVLTSWTEGMQHFWRVSPWVPTITGSATLCVMLAAIWVYRRLGQESKAYARMNALETVSFAVTCGSVILFSGYAENPMWIFHFGHVVQCGLAGFQRKHNLIIFCTLALVLSLWFAWGNSITQTAIVFLLGVFSVLTYALLSSTSERLRATTLQRDALAADLAEARVAAERQRIARDLHDGVASDLAALHWQLEGLRSLVPESDASEQFLNTLSQRLTQGSEELRNIVWALRAQELNWQELGELLAQRCQELTGSLISCEFSFTGEEAERLAPELQAELTRCVQEAVRNAVRHSGCSKVSISLDLKDEVLLTISDNGRGLPEEKLRASSGGLANLHRRVENLGGRLTFSDAKPGTRLTAKLPLK